MVTRVGLDASHASKSITAWREKKPSYKGKLNRICRATFFITAYSARVVCFQYGPTEHIFSQFFGCSCHWLERRSATGRRGATLCFSGSQRGYLWCGLGGPVVSSWRGRSWRGNTLALSQPAGSVSILNFILPITSYFSFTNTINYYTILVLVELFFNVLCYLN